MQETKQDRANFLDAMTALNPTIGDYCQQAMARGADIRTVVAALRTASKTANGWLIGRFGS